MAATPPVGFIAADRQLNPGWWYDPNGDPNQPSTWWEQVPLGWVEDPNAPGWYLKPNSDPNQPEHWWYEGRIQEPQPIAPPPPDFHIVRKATPNQSGRDGHLPIAIVLHTMAGTLAGCDGWFANPASQVSAHFGIGLGGEAHQYVDLSECAWANGVLEPGAIWTGPAGVNPNKVTVSIETEDNGNPDQEVTQLQYEATLWVCRVAVASYPSITMLDSHRAISPRSRAHCPGDRWIVSGRFRDLAVALGVSALA